MIEVLGRLAGRQKKSGVGKSVFLHAAKAVMFRALSGLMLLGTLSCALGDTYNFDATATTTLSSKYPTTPLHMQNIFNVYASSAGNDYGDFIGLVNFDISSIPRGSRVDLVYVYLTAQYCSEEGDVNLGIVSRPWSEDTATYNNGPGSPAPIGTLYGTSGESGQTVVWCWASTDFPGFDGVMQHCINSPSSAPFHGFMLRAATYDAFTSFYSRREQNTYRRPSMVIYSTKMPDVTVSGRVTDSVTGNGVDGVKITFEGGYGTATTSGGGYYTKTMTWDWTTMATPSHASGGSFSPSGRPSSHTQSNISNWNFVWTAPSTPPNDTFANATSISGSSGQVTGSNVGATLESGEPNDHGGQSVWWRWTAPASGNVTFDTFGSNFDTKLAAYRGSSVGSLTVMGSNDDADGTRQSQIQFSVVGGTTYRIAVGGYSTRQGDITLNWNLVTPPPTPTGVSATDGAYTDKVRVTWNSSSGATAYEVWRHTSNSSGSASKISNPDPTGTSYDDTTAVAGTTYYYWVKAKNAGGTSGFSSSDSGYRQVGSPPVPTGVSATDGAYTDKVRVTWNSSSGATAYEVWRHTSNSSGSASKISNPDPTGTSYDDTTAVAGTTYYYWVKAKNAGGTSGFSSSDSGYRQSALTITTSSLLPDGTVDRAYSVTLAASGGKTPYTWSLDSGNLPDGLNLSSGGVISGTPTASGTFNFTIRVTGDDNRSSTKAFSQVVMATTEQYQVAIYGETAGFIPTQHVEFAENYRLDSYNNAAFDANVGRFTASDIDVICIGGDDEFSVATAQAIEAAVYDDGKILLINFWSNRKFDAALPASNSGSALEGTVMTVVATDSPVFTDLPHTFTRQHDRDFYRELATPRAGSTVLIEYADGSPALIYWRYGNGWVVQWTSEQMGGFIDAATLDTINYRLLTMLLTQTVPQVVFSEDWESGQIDTGKWKIWGYPAPTIVSGGNSIGNYALTSNGDASYESGVTSLQSFEVRPGLTVSAKVFVQAPGTDVWSKRSWHGLALSSRPPAEWGNSCGAGDALIGRASCRERVSRCV